MLKIDLLLFVLKALRPFFSLIFWVLGKLGVKFFKSRLQFEYKNKEGSFSSSFSHVSEKADWALEISSEGEWEQAKAWVMNGLYRGEKFEILFASPSVEGKMIRLVREFPEKVRILRLPLLSLGLPKLMGGQNIANWPTASRLVFVRYDFFPELIEWGRKDNREIFLISGTLKGKGDVNSWKSFIYPYLSFKKILAVTELDRQRFIEWGVRKEDILVYDFRHQSIGERLEKRESSLQKLKHLPEIVDLMTSIPKDRRVLLAQVWESDLRGLFSFYPDVLRDISSQHLVWIAPHTFNKEIVSSLYRSIKDSSGQMEVKFVDETTSAHEMIVMKELAQHKGLVVISLLKGVLLEFYPFFDKCFVGGGFGRSVHSLLEPFWGGLEIYCGPRVHRSTEWDFVCDQSPQSIQIVDSKTSVENLFFKCQLSEEEKREREKKMLNIKRGMKNAISHLEGHISAR